MTKLFKRLSVRELILFLGMSVMGMVSVVGVMAEGEGDMVLQTAYGKNVQHPSCLDNFYSWNKSDVRKDNSDWNLNNFPSHVYNHYNQSLQQFVDMNGDGLLDYIYFWKTNTTGLFNAEDSCILINNGHGWDIAYKCITRGRSVIGGYEIDYYGDCADVENSTL